MRAKQSSLHTLEPLCTLNGLGLEPSRFVVVQLLPGRLAPKNGSQPYAWTAAVTDPLGERRLALRGVYPGADAACRRFPLSKGRVHGDQSLEAVHSFQASGSAGQTGACGAALTECPAARLGQGGAHWAERG